MAAGGQQCVNHMNDQLNFKAIMAWAAFGSQDYSNLERYGGEIYNYFVHNPSGILKLDSPLLIGKIFQVCLGFQDPDEDIQEVRAENAFLCFSQALKSGKVNVHDEAAARLMLLLIIYRNHLINKVAEACKSSHVDPYSIFGMVGDDLPNDMPMDINTKMLFVAYYLYDGIIDKTNVINEFVNTDERRAFEYVKNHVLENSRQLDNTSSDRKIELGGIVFKKICDRLQADIEQYSNN